MRTRVHASDLERVAFFGDDVSDLPASRPWTSSSTAGGVAGLKVAVTGSEAPSELIERADLVLASPEEAVGLLTSLAGRLGAAP